MKMILLKFVFIIGVLTTVARADCPLIENPAESAKCLRYATDVLLGAALNDLKMACSAAAVISDCLTNEMGDCVAAEIGKAALEEVKSLSRNCCPRRDNAKCTIRDSVLSAQRCFAADSLVTLTNGNQISMTDLQSGHSVLAYDDKTKKIVSTQVLTMLDYQPHQFAMFKQVTTVSGRQLSLTSSHLLPTDTHGYVMAKNIRVGMNIYVMDDNDKLISETISNVTDIVQQGYIAPLTEEGTLIVNNFAASCYATINSHHVAHAALAPMRWWYSLFGMSTESSEMIGVPWFPKMLYEMTTFLMPSIIQK